MREGPPDVRKSGLESRRDFFKLLAGSPLLALAYPALPAIWQELVSKESPRGAAGWRFAGPCPDCGREMVFASAADIRGYATQSGLPQANTQINRFLEGQLEGQLVETVDEAINVWDFEKVLHANVSPEHWAYIHLGVADFETRRANREGFQRLQLLPRRLGRDVTDVDTSVELFGRRWDTPLFLCPVASLEAYHTEGESGAARAARARGILQIQSTVSSQSYEEISEARGEPHWFQIYTDLDWNVNKRLIDRVETAGCPVLVWTVDLLGGSNRELLRRVLGADGTNQPRCLNCHNHQPGYQKPMRSGLAGPAGPQYPYTWDYVKRLKDATGMKLVLKGINTREDAELAVEHGADGILVSNHGGRAEASNRSTIEALPEVAAGVRRRVPILFDSGIRRGTDIFKALALGADAVGIGRPYVWGLGAFGHDGVDKVIEMLIDEFRMTMRQSSTTAIDQITPWFVREGRAPLMMRSNDLGFGL